MTVGAPLLLFGAGEDGRRELRARIPVVRAVAETPPEPQPPPDLWRARIEPTARDLLKQKKPRHALRWLLDEAEPEILGLLDASLQDQRLAIRALLAWSTALERLLLRPRPSPPSRASLYRLAFFVLSEANAWGPVTTPEPHHTPPLLQPPEGQTLLFPNPSLRRALAQLQDALTPQERFLLILRLGRAMTWTEIAQVMSSRSSPGAAATWRARYLDLKERMRALLHTAPSADPPDRAFSDRL